MPAAFWTRVTQSRLPLVLVFLFSLVVFAWLQPRQMLADPDSFYHARLTTLMRDGGLVREFPWTQSSLYRETFIDHHLGYHLLLIPFLSLGPELVGLQVATVVFAALTITFAAWLLRRWGVPWWGMGVAFLLTTGPFLFRLSLGKAPSLGVGVALVAYYLITARRAGWLFWWAWFFTWLYSAWPLLPAMAGLFILVDSVPDLRFGLVAFWRRLIRQGNRQLLVSVVGGCAAGLVVNPYFPINLTYLKQLFTMALIAYHKFIGVGAEWYPYNPFDLPADLAYPLLTWLLATVAAALTLKRQSVLSRTTWLLAVIFLAYTLRARRQVEYLVPWLVLSSGVALRDTGFAWSVPALHEAWQAFRGWLPRVFQGRLLIGFLLVYLMVLVPIGFASGLREAYSGLRQRFDFSTLAGAATWLKQNTPPRSIVFQTDWGTFPMLFYHNTHNYYLTGLDQTFMYEYSPDRYWQWVRVTTGERRDVYVVARETFGASYLLVEKRVAKVLPWVNRDARFSKVYEDDEALIYALGLK